MDFDGLYEILYQVIYSRQITIPILAVYGRPRYNLNEESTRSSSYMPSGFIFLDAPDDRIPYRMFSH